MVNEAKLIIYYHRAFSTDTQEVGLRKTKVTTLGRSSKCDVQFALEDLPKSQRRYISRFQATILYDDEKRVWRIFDGNISMGPSHNGIKVNDTPVISSDRLEYGATITFAEVPNLRIEGVFKAEKNYITDHLEFPTWPGDDDELTKGSRRPLSHIPAGAKMKHPTNPRIRDLKDVGTAIDEFAAKTTMQDIKKYYLLAGLALLTGAAIIVLWEAWQVVKKAMD